MKHLLMIAIFLMGSLAIAEEKKLGLFNQSELGYVVTGGNSESETTSFKQKTEQVWSWDIIRLTGHYIQSSGQVVVDQATGEQNTQITAENWSANLRWEHILTPKWFNAFVAHGWYGDRFQGVREGHASDIGAKYFTANSDTYKQFFELGYRYTRELLTADPRAADPTASCVGVGSCIQPEYHYARLYAQADYAYSKTFSLGVWVEYLPSITDFSKDQRINFSPYIQSILSDIFSLKVAYESRYRHETAVKGAKNTDYTFTTSLLASF